MLGPKTHTLFPWNRTSTLAKGSPLGVITCVPITTDRPHVLPPVSVTAPRKVQLVEVHAEPMAQPYWALAKATASVVDVGGYAGDGEAVGLAGSGDRLGASEVDVVGTTVGFTPALAQPASSPTMAKALRPAVL